MEEAELARRIKEDEETMFAMPAEFANLGVAPLN